MAVSLALVGYSEAIHFDGLSANRRLRADGTRWVARNGRALPVKLT